MIDPKIPTSITRSSLDAIDKVEAPDNYTVVFKMKYPFAPFFTAASHNWAPIVPPELIESGESDNKMVGTGPFVLKNWQRDVKLEFDRNPEYFITGHPYAQKVVIRIVPDAAGRLANFRSGETDRWAGLPPSTPLEVIENVQRGLGDGVVRMEYKASAGTVTKNQFDTTNEPFKDKRLRQAFLYGFPYDDFIKINAGYAARTSAIAAGNKEWSLAEKDMPAPDPAKAKALLAEAGYSASNPLKVTSTFYTPARATAEVVQNLMKAVGIKIQLQVMESAEWVQKIYRGTVPYQMATYTDAGLEDPDRQLYPLFPHDQVQWDNVWYDPIPPGRA